MNPTDTPYACIGAVHLPVYEVYCLFRAEMSPGELHGVKFYFDKGILRSSQEVYSN